MTDRIRQHELIPSGAVWHISHHCDDSARTVFKRHYSYNPARNRTTSHFVAPGENLVLLSPTHDALFIWVLEKYRKDGQQGVNCAAFRNESNRRASDLILAAEEFAWRKWPGQRLFTFVDSRKIRSSNPGYCFIKAGWQRCGMTKGGLHILEKLP